MEIANLTSKPRVSSIDFLRGLVMIIMALDHSRDFFFKESFSGHDPLDFATTTVPIFLTRWITHFCAPTFVFLSGISIFFLSQKKTKKELCVFLLTRGLFLVVMELTVVNFAWDWNIHFSNTYLGVIWVIGWSMICLSVLIFLPKTIILIIGLVFVCGHNLLDGYDHANEENETVNIISALLHFQFLFHTGLHHTVIVIYPFIPWLGVMALGFIFGHIYHKDFDPVRRKKILLGLGFSLIGIFILLRSGNFYGDYAHWNNQANDPFTILSFLKTTKYPPSLLFLTMTIGPGMLLLALFENIHNPIQRIITVFGRVPFFYYVLHLYLIHLVAAILFFAQGNSLENLDPSKHIGGIPASYGVNLWQTYLLWALVVSLLYFPCKWYNKYKSTHTQWWLSYV